MAEEGSTIDHNWKRSDMDIGINGITAYEEQVKKLLDGE